MNVKVSEEQRIHTNVVLASNGNNPAAQFIGRSSAGMICNANAKVMLKWNPSIFCVYILVFEGNCQLFIGNWFCTVLGIFGHLFPCFLAFLLFPVFLLLLECFASASPMCCVTASCSLRFSAFPASLSAFPCFFAYLLFCFSAFPCFFVAQTAHTADNPWETSYIKINPKPTKETLKQL